MFTLTKDTFGMRADIKMPMDCDVLVVCVDLHQHVPVMIKLAHQLRVEDIQKIFDEHPGARSITVMPYRNKDKVEIAKEPFLAALSETA